MIHSWREALFCTMCIPSTIMILQMFGTVKKLKVVTTADTINHAYSKVILALLVLVFICIVDWVSIGPLPVAGALRPRGSTGDSQLHCHLLPGGAGWEDTDTLPQPPHWHYCQTQHMGSCTGETVHTALYFVTLCYTLLHHFASLLLCLHVTH